MDPRTVIGRERERSTAFRLLHSVPTGPVALHLVGDAGIGKTTLFEAVVADARSQGFKVAVARPTQSERSLSFVGLTDLLAGARSELGRLADPLRAALETALLLRPSDQVPDPRAIAMGVLGMIEALAARPPGLLLAIDDVQWLDAASSSALSFALRRADAIPVAVLTTARERAADSAIEVGRAFTREVLEVPPLSLGAIRALVSDRLGLSLPRPRLVRLYELSYGNPLIAMEVARALESSGWDVHATAFARGQDPDSLFVARLATLSDDTRALLGIVAATANPTIRLLESTAANPGDVAAAIEEAVRAGVLRRETDALSFTHPLFASAAYASLGAKKRRSVHQRVAAVVDGIEERARHLALASEGPDEPIAQALEAASRAAANRGAWVSAAELADLAMDMTPKGDPGQRRSRRLWAAERRFLAGDAVGSRGLLEELLGELGAGPARARVLLQLAESYSGDLNVMVPLRRRAVADAATDDRIAALAHRELARTLFVGGSPQEAFEEAQLAIAAAERAGDQRLLVVGLSYLAFLQITTGHLEAAILDRALAAESGVGYLRDYESPSLVDGLRLMHLEDDLEGARARIEQVDRTAREHGDEESRAIILSHLAHAEYRSGRYDDGARHAAQVFEIREQFGLPTAGAQYWVALGEVLRGRSGATPAVSRAVEACEATGNLVYALRGRWLLGHLALAAGRWADAAAALGPLPARADAAGYGVMRVLEVLPDAIESSIGVGDLDTARSLLGSLRDKASDVATRSPRARLVRANGLLAMAEGRLDEAAGVLGRAAGMHQLLPEPLELGRSLLALGRTHRRAGHRREARETLGRAASVFEEIGAELWLGQARAEVARLGGRASAGTGLTAAEAAVARLVVEGRSNREVATELVVTERTVETHLSSIYRKLEVRSRTELARRYNGDSVKPA